MSAMLVFTGIFRGFGKANGRGPCAKAAEMPKKSASELNRSND
jgi:hypothetical protein